MSRLSFLLVFGLFLFASNAIAVSSKYKSKTFQFSKKQSLSLNYKAVFRSLADESRRVEYGSGVSYRYSIDEKKSFGVDWSASSSKFKSGAVEMDLEFMDILFSYDHVLHPSDKDFRIKAGLGLINEEVKNSVYGSAVSVDEWRPIYALGLSYKFLLSDLFDSSNNKLRNWQYDLGLMYRGEFKSNHRSYVDLKVFGLGYRF